MIIALFPNEKKHHSFELAASILEFFANQGITVVAEDEKAKAFGAKPFSSIDLQQIDFLISMGGDGTLLRIAHQYNHLKAPILGINLGHLGFMADIPVSDIFPSLSELLKGNFTIEERLVLEAKHKDTSLYAVNDIVIHRAQNYSLIEISIHVNGAYVNTFLADGVIIATPTGSTAYNLAAGGPIISPNVDALVITPICPHTISNRPIVISSHGVLELQYLSHYDPIDVRADGLNAFSLPSEEKIVLSQAERKFRIVNLKRHEYFSTLRSKLGWSGKLR